MFSVSDYEKTEYHLDRCVKLLSKHKRLQEELNKKEERIEECQNGLSNVLFAAEATAEAIAIDNDRLKRNMANLVENRDKYYGEKKAEDEIVNKLFERVTTVLVRRKRLAAGGVKKKVQMLKEKIETATELKLDPLSWILKWIYLKDKWFPYLNGCIKTQHDVFQHDVFDQDVFEEINQELKEVEEVLRKAFRREVEDMIKEDEKKGYFLPEIIMLHRYKVLGMRTNYYTDLQKERKKEMRTKYEDWVRRQDGDILYRNIGREDTKRDINRIEETLSVLQESQPSERTEHSIDDGYKTPP